MATLEEIGQALQKAHAAGDVESARILANAYALMRDAPKKVELPKASASESVLSEMSPMERFTVGVGKGAADAVSGVTSLFGYNDPFNLGDTSEQDKALENTTAVKIGSVVGNIAATAPTVLIPGANTIKGASLIGAGVGGLTNKGDAEQRLKNAGLGAIGGGAGAALPWASNVVGKVFAPLGSEKQKEKIIGGLLNNLVGEDAPKIINNLESAAPIIPGSNPTAAEVAKSGGLAAFQRAMSDANPQAYSNRWMEQASARKNAIRSIAQDENALQQAISNRSSAVEPLYKQADESIVPVDSSLSEIIKRLPNGTMAKAKDIARMENKPFQFGEDIAATQKPSGILDAKGNPIMVDQPAQYSEISGRGLDLIKKAIDDVVDVNPTASIGKHSKNAATGVKSDLLNWADSNIPAYGEARKTFAELSKPINQMQVGQELLNKIEPALGKHGELASETGATYARALNDVRGNLVKQATGGIKQKLEDVMTPEQMQLLNGVAQDLARKAYAQTEGRNIGSNTFQNFAMNGISQAAGVPSFVSGLLHTLPVTRQAMTGINAAGKKLYEGADKELKTMIAEALLDPKKTAELMKKANQKGLLEKVLPQAGALPGLLGMSLLPAAQQ